MISTFQKRKIEAQKGQMTSPYLLTPGPLLFLPLTCSSFFADGQYIPDVQGLSLLYLGNKVLMRK